MDLFQGWLTDLDLHGTRLALLVLGHVAADFLLQPYRLVCAKREKLRWMALHTGIVFASHAVFFAPFLTWPVLGVLAVVAVVHGATDWAKVRVEQALEKRERCMQEKDGTARLRRHLWPFLADQTLHLAVLVSAWLLVAGPLAAGPWFWLSASGADAVTAAAVVVAALLFNGMGGMVVVRGVLKDLGSLPSDGKPGDVPKYGGAIGILERTLVFLFVLLGAWAAVGFVVAAKSIIRFGEFRDRGDHRRHFAEYFLVGTLTSLLLAVLLGLFVRWTTG